MFVVGPEITAAFAVLRVFGQPATRGGYVDLLS